MVQRYKQIPIQPNIFNIIYMRCINISSRRSMIKYNKYFILTYIIRLLRLIKWLVH